MTAGPPTVAINAQKLNLTDSYHAAGLSRYLFNLLSEIRQLGAPEQILAYVRAAQSPPEFAPTTSFRLRPSRWPTDSPLARIAWEQAMFPGLLQRDRVDLLHGPVYALPVAWRGPGILTIFDLAFIAMPWAFRRRNRAYLRVMSWLGARQASRVITISEATRRDVVRWLKIAPDKVTAIHCGVDHQFRPLRDEMDLDAFRARNGLPQEFILYLATIEPRKNLIRLIDAYAQLRARGATDLPLILAGGRGWGYRPIFEHAARTGLGDAIRFVGFVPGPELVLWYNAATLFVYPSEYEGFGIPPLEALACGTPVVSSTSSSLPEVLGEAAMLVDPSSGQAIADGIQRVLDDAGLRERLKQAGPQRAKQFSWRAMAEATMAVYREVL